MYTKIIFAIWHVRLLVDIQFRFATVHSSVMQPEPASIGSVLPRQLWSGPFIFLSFEVYVVG